MSLRGRLAGEPLRDVCSLLDYLSKYRHMPRMYLKRASSNSTFGNPYHNVCIARVTSSPFTAQWGKWFEFAIWSNQLKLQYSPWKVTESDLRLGPCIMNTSPKISSININKSLKQGSNQICQSEDTSDINQAHVKFIQRALILINRSIDKNILKSFRSRNKKCILNQLEVTSTACKGGANNTSYDILLFKVWFRSA